MIKRQYFTMEDIQVDLNSMVDNEPLAMPLVSLIESRYRLNWVIWTDNDVDPWENDVDIQPDADKAIQWQERFVYIYNATKDRYLKLITLFKENENKLMGKLESATTTKFNDTPQNAGDFTGDGYTTTVTNVNTAVDSEDIVSRLNKIYSSIKNIYNEWLGEFDSLFGTSVAL